jgi:hypothetical protein
MALVRVWVGVSAFDRAAFKTVVKSCVEAARVREDLADIINIAIDPAPPECRRSRLSAQSFE